MFGSGVREDDDQNVDHAALEILRIRVVEAVEAGQYSEDVATSMGIN